jgi:TetR/AcrR family transcriptional regulator of autoinduction and epiphytic fitness
MTMVIKKIDSRRNRKKAEARAQIIATAMDLFSRHGLEGVTVEHIADVADLGKGTIYNYFQTKEDIVVAFMVEKERKVQARLARLSASQGSLGAILTEFLQFQFRMKRPYHKFVRVFLAQMFLRTEQLFPYLVEMQKSIDENLRLLFRRLQERGLMRKDIAIADLIPIFKTMHLGLTGLWAIEGPPFSATEQLMKQEIKLFCEGLEAKRK